MYIYTQIKPDFYSCIYVYCSIYVSALPWKNTATGFSHFLQPSLQHLITPFQEHLLAFWFDTMNLITHQIIVSTQDVRNSLWKEVMRCWSKGFQKFKNSVTWFFHCMAEWIWVFIPVRVLISCMQQSLLRDRRACIFMSHISASPYNCRHI